MFVVLDEVPTDPNIFGDTVVFTAIFPGLATAVFEDVVYVTTELLVKVTCGRNDCEIVPTIDNWLLVALILLKEMFDMFLIL